MVQEKVYEGCLCTFSDDSMWKKKKGTNKMGSSIKIPNLSSSETWELRPNAQQTEWPHINVSYAYIPHNTFTENQEFKEWNWS